MTDHDPSWTSMSNCGRHCARFRRTFQRPRFSRWSNAASGAGNARARELVGAAVVAVVGLGAVVGLVLSASPQLAATGTHPHPPTATSTTSMSDFSAAGRASLPAASSLSPGTAQILPCPNHLLTPVEADGRFCGPMAGPGNGDGPDGTCNGTEKIPPCGPGVVLGRYYEYTMPGTCSGLIWFNNKQWVSELPPPSPTSNFYVWMRLGPGGTLGWVSPKGAVGFQALHRTGAEHMSRLNGGESDSGSTSRTRQRHDSA